MEQSQDKQDGSSHDRKPTQDSSHGNTPPAAGQGNGDNAKRSKKQFGRQQGQDNRPYNPINLPRISFMSPEHGAEVHAESSEGKDSPQMSLFEGGSNDQP